MGFWRNTIYMLWWDAFTHCQSWIEMINLQQMHYFHFLFIKAALQHIQALDPSWIRKINLSKTNGDDIQGADKISTAMNAKYLKTNKTQNPTEKLKRQTWLERFMHHLIEVLKKFSESSQKWFLQCENW